ncbi:hypothetical protein L484_010055 [Morus notabilis]|uniref:DUF8039 domain-containing protein n=1 Tax=Morus notabilis TaxID=981085 RepID=W9S3I7_9ROSA|nr:hypothetical protein L484_010055 [Morus notabilis]
MEEKYRKLHEEKDTAQDRRRQGKKCKLVIDVVNNIVADGFVYETNDVNATVHGIRLGEINYRVSVTLARGHYACLPIPIPAFNKFCAGNVLRPQFDSHMPGDRRLRRKPKGGKGILCRLLKESPRRKLVRRVCLGIA